MIVIKEILNFLTLHFYCGLNADVDEEFYKYFVNMRKKILLELFLI